MVYPAWLKGGCRLLPGDSRYICFVRLFCEALNENKDEFIAYNVDVSYFGYHYTFKGVITLYASGGTVAPLIASVYLNEVWSM